MDATGAIAFVCAMPMEVKPLEKRLRLAEEERNGVRVRAGSLDGRDVVAIVTGMGTALARAGTERLLDAVAVERVVVVGITGAIDHDVAIGTVLCPALVVDSASGAEHRPSPMAPGPPEGVLWTTDAILAGEAVLADLRAKGVIGLDMETAAIAAVCEERGIPWSVFRAVSDGPADEVDQEVFELSHQDGTPNPRNIARYVARHPGRIPAMARMGKQVKVATDAAAKAAIAACRSAASS